MIFIDITNMRIIFLPMHLYYMHVYAYKCCSIDTSFPV